MAYGPFNHVALSGWTLCLFVSPIPLNKRSATTPAPRRIPPPWCFLCCWWRWLLSVSCWWQKIGPLLLSGCLLLLHGFSVALKSFPALVPSTMHVDPGWLLPPVSLYITVYWYCFWPLIFFFLSFLLCHPCLSFSLNLPPFFLWLFPLLCACLGLREKGGLGAVCLKPSRVNLLRPSTVRKDCISRFPVFVPPPCFVF